jgi:hypothetical protein
MNDKLKVDADKSGMLAKLMMQDPIVRQFNPVHIFTSYFSSKPFQYYSWASQALSSLEVF